MHQSQEEINKYKAEVEADVNQLLEDTGSDFTLEDVKDAIYNEEENNEIPQIIKDVGFDFDWSEPKVWALEVPVEEIDVNELAWHFDIPFWDENGSYNLTPRAVIDNPEAHKEEYERTMKADTSHPIDIMENKGRWLILDGLHRLVKLFISGEKTVKVRKISRDLIPEII